MWQDLLSSEKPVIFSSVRSPEQACVLKSEGADTLLRALDSLWHHDRFRSRGITAGCDDITAADGKLRTLTPCERETAGLVSEG